jgi:NAD(P) transhydrogenase
VIGCEYATIFASLGIPVYLINKQNRILGFLDEEISDELVKQMLKQGVDIIFESEVDKIVRPTNEKDALNVTLSTGENLHVDMFLFAAGRSGNTQELDCQKVGIKLTKREAIEVNENYQTSVDNIYAVGDVIGFPALASTSMDQGRVAVAHMFDTRDLDSIAKTIPFGIYTIPEVSMVGVTEQYCQENNIDYCVGRAYHKDMARGRIMGLEDGLMKIIFSTDGLKILGVHVVGPTASELIHYGLSLVENEKTLLQVIATVFNYPTLHDLYKYACYDGLGKTNQKVS